MLLMWLHSELQLMSGSSLTHTSNYTPQTQHSNYPWNNLDTPDMPPAHHGQAYKVYTWTTYL